MIISTLLLSSVLFAQKVTNKPPVSTTVPTPSSTPASTSAHSTVSLTVSEQLAVSYLVKEGQKVQDQEKELIQSFNALIQEIEKNHPGYRFNQQTMNLEKIPTSSVEKEKK